MDICGFVLYHCMLCMLRDQNLAPLNCGVSFETLIFLENSHFIEYKVEGEMCPSILMVELEFSSLWSVISLGLFNLTARAQ